MSFDNHYPNRKDRRKPYYGSKSFDRTCRNGGSCPYCSSGRKHKRTRADRAAKKEIEEFT